MKLTDRVHRLAILTLAFALFSLCSYAGKITYTFNDTLVFNFEFETSYSKFVMNLRGNDYVVGFTSQEDMVLQPATFFQQAIESATMQRNGNDYTITFHFNKLPDKQPELFKQGGGVRLVFTLPAYTPRPFNITNQALQSQPSQTSIYFSMIFYLAIVLAILWALYWFLRKFVKRNVVTDIPGTGHLLGRVDLEYRKSLYFYEIGRKVYILGVTDNAVTLVDILESDEDLAVIKSGFARRTEFSSYMGFFNRKGEGEIGGIDAEMDIAKTVISDKLNSIRNRK